jgi:hypothetical protein
MPVYQHGENAEIHQGISLINFPGENIFSF